MFLQNSTERSVSTNELINLKITTGTRPMYQKNRELEMMCVRLTISSKRTVDLLVQFVTHLYFVFLCMQMEFENFSFFRLLCVTLGAGWEN